MIDISTIKGAIFDMDGTILDSMFIWENVEIDYLISMGKTPKKGLKEILRPFSGLESAGYIRTEYGLNKTAEEIEAGVNRLLEDFYFHKASPKKGVLEVLAKLHDRGVKMCIATVTDRYLAEPALRRCGIIDYFGRIFTSGEERMNKRNPEMFYRAANFLGTEAHETLVIEDAYYAVKTAKLAGFPVVAVYDRTSEDKTDVIKSHCDVYCITMDEMLDWI